MFTGDIVLDSRDLGNHKGFDIMVYAVKDYDVEERLYGLPESLQESFERNEWELVIVTTVASRAGVELGYSHLSGVVSGTIGDTLHNPFEEAMSYCQVTSAIDDAAITLAQILAPVSETAAQGR